MTCRRMAFEFMLCYMENVSWIGRAAGCPNVPVVEKKVNKMIQRPVITEEEFVTREK